jgi:hypothetical protein
MDEVELFPCYSEPLKEFLKSKNIRYKLSALNKNTLKTMYIYIDNDDLKEALIEWRETKPKA